jgi:hypothetical protein
LQQQAFSAPQNETVGGQIIKQSPLQGLARLAQALVSNKMQNDADTDQRGLITRQQQQLAETLKAYGQATDPSQKAAILMQHPQTQAAGLKMLEQQPEGVAINGQLVNKSTGAPMGAQIAKQAEPFSLKAGESRFGPDGNLITQVSDFNKPFNADGTPNKAFQGFEIAKHKAGANNQTVNVAGPENKYGQVVGEGLAKEGLSLVELAKQAPEVVRNAQAIRSALDKGAITGTGAETRFAVQKALETAGVVGKGKAASTEELMAGLGKLTLAGIKTSGLGGGNGFTDKDREFLSAAISGQITGTKENLRRVADLSERVAMATHQKGQKVLERWNQNPALKGVAQDSTIDPLPVSSDIHSQADAILNGGK